MDFSLRQRVYGMGYEFFKKFESKNRKQDSYWGQGTLYLFVSVYENSSFPVKGLWRGQCYGGAVPKQEGKKGSYYPSTLAFFKGPAEKNGKNFFQFFLKFPFNFS